MSYEIVSCTKCSRLRTHCNEIAKTKRRAYQNEEYWGRPVPDFGDSTKGGLWIVGLAPGAHGANRTGRLFTGDQSGAWLYRALFESGLSNLPQSENSQDKLILHKSLITNVVHCAPPGNKPSKEEILNCRPFFKKSFEMKTPKVIVALGKIAWEECLKLEEFRDLERPLRKFKNGAELKCGGMTLLGSFHPSQQNTFTGKLKWDDFLKTFKRAATLIDIHK